MPVLSVLSNVPFGSAYGFFTREMRSERQRVGFVVERLDGKSCLTLQKRDELVGRVVGWVEGVLAGA